MFGRFATIYAHWKIRWESPTMLDCLCRVNEHKLNKFFRGELINLQLPYHVFDLFSRMLTLALTIVFAYLWWSAPTRLHKMKMALMVNSSTRDRWRK
jgi:hypothetical protein